MKIRRGDRRQNRHRHLLKFLGLMLLFAALWLPASATDEGGKKRTELRHLVVFKFKDTTTPKQIDSVIDAFRALKDKIPQVSSIESGINNSSEHMNKGLTHAFLVSFSGTKNRDIYLTHPEHLKFKKLALPLVADAFVIDFFGKPCDSPSR